MIMDFQAWRWRCIRQTQNLGVPESVVANANHTFDNQAFALATTRSTKQKFVGLKAWLPMPTTRSTKQKFAGLKAWLPVQGVDV
jgi:hypothetical protein